MFRTAYILTFRQDFFWFWLLPFLAVGFALFCQQSMTGVALATVGVWITMPHQFASWLRTYGIPEERRLWTDRLYVAPLLIFFATLAGYAVAPISTALFVILWDHQHSIMQQHGFARIYDFRGRTGAPSTGWFDLLLGWILFGNMLITSPMFMWPLVRELYRLRLPVTSNAIQMTMTISWTVLTIYGVIYTAHVVWCARKGYALNPIKYVFIGCSYFLWYFCAWHTSSVLVWGIAHRIMHGVQYIVMVYWYLRRQTSVEGSESRFAASLVQPGHILGFLALGLFYSLVVQVVTGGQLGVFLFGWKEYPTLYEAIPALGLKPMSPTEGYAFVANAFLNSLGLTHYYFDSFIWKVRDRRVQGGLA
ncbi:MAG: hypothetical protein JNM43_22900 [Planctomycetaceae bacterium]|nr:hypothetical protein [Planctomycetaceae bacterium]